MVAAFGWLLVPHHHWVRLVQEWLSELGPWAPLIFVAIHVIAIVALIPGAVFSVAAGVLYGPWGFALAVLGATIGASAAFLIARYFARRRVGELIAARPRLDAVRAAARPLFDSIGGDRIDTVVLACTHFPLLEDELRVAFPGVDYVHGGDGIARRIAYLTREQPWPTSPSEGVMLFTSAARAPSLGALARYGIGEVKTL